MSSTQRFTRNYTRWTPRSTIKAAPAPKKVVPEFQNVYASPTVTVLPKAKPKVSAQVQQIRRLAAIINQGQRRHQTQKIDAWYTAQTEFLQEMYFLIEEHMEAANPFTWLQWCQFCLDHSSPSPTKHTFEPRPLQEVEQPEDLEPISECFTALQDYAYNEFQSLLNQIGTREQFIRFYYRVL
jgi:hypothetical protein